MNLVRIQSSGIAAAISGYSRNGDDNANMGDNSLGARRYHLTRRPLIPSGDGGETSE